jgi:hypothetical protein
VSGFLTRHGAHLIVMGGPFLLMIGMFAALQLDGRARLRTTSSPLVALLAVCWVASATIHLLVIREHFDEALALGLFFLVTTVVQCGYALAVSLRPSRQLLAAGLTANLGMIALWAYTRMVSVPFGLGPRERVGVADVTATAFEAVAVMLAVVALRRLTSAGSAGELLALRTAVRSGRAGPVLVVDGAADSAVVA